MRLLACPNTGFGYKYMRVKRRWRHTVALTVSIWHRESHRNLWNVMESPQASFLSVNSGSCPRTAFTSQNGSSEARFAWVCPNINQHDRCTLFIISQNFPGLFLKRIFWHWRNFLNTVFTACHSSQPRQLQCKETQTHSKWRAQPVISKLNTQLNNSLEPHL